MPDAFAQAGGMLRQKPKSQLNGFDFPGSRKRQAGIEAKMTKSIRKGKSLMTSVHQSDLQDEMNKRSAAHRELRKVPSKGARR